MYKKAAQGWLKHWDFILLDIICLQIAFIIAYFLRQGGGNPYADPLYRSEAISFILCQIVVVFFSQSYQGILKRGYYSEFTKTVGRIERGDSTPSAEVMLRISKYFNMLVEDVFHVED